MVILSRAQNGGAKTPDVWTRKLLCSCGHKFNRVRWHTRIDGSVEHAYNCYDKIRTGSHKTGEIMIFVRKFMRIGRRRRRL